MKIRRAGAAIAAAATGALLFSACSSPAGNQDDEATPTETATEQVEADTPCKADLGEVTTADGNISYSVGEDEFLGYNSNTPETYSTYNSAVTERMIGSFIYFGTDGTICRDETYGTFEAVSEDPLQVKYTIADDAVWSDGTPISYADYLLEWAAQAITTDGAVTKDGTETPLFNHISGLTLGDYVPEGPKADSADAKEFQYDYERIYADWQLMVGGAFPAHVVAEQVGVSTDELVTAIQELDMSVLEPAAEFWNTGWLSPTPGELPDPALVPVSGPYTFKENGWVAGQSITLTANENYWGTPPATKELTFRFAAADTHVQALQNGDLDVIEPQATVDTIGQLEALGSSVTITTGQTLTWEHLDFNFKSGIFADSLPAREAFAYCVPRQKIVDDLIKPIDETAVVMNAREVFPFQTDKYDEVVSAAYDGRYDEADLDMAKQKFEEAGLEEGTEVRIGYSAPNPRRADEVAAIKASCDQVGFNVVDAGDPAFFDTVLPNADYEVALFAWAGSGQIASGQNIYATTGTQNYGGYSDEVVDEAWDTLASTVDESVHLEQTKVIEKQLWDTLFGIPLFAHPGVAAFSSDLQNVRDTAAQSGIVWNAEQWARAS
ncbi:ABC transporter substrate-binding protein [Isoptericola variabilis]|uniref:ABC-type transporter, periplasmic subunit n=1 Tax=Isoptericola variabilis (strain 225) TaxID=743718 RepID=F6FPJ0_ISOV2|nr:ABC transporter substrate-binding protein [Isoptericola variabilis]AEG43703.1 ABC-type transporter, periplasmic subunit [Isoptericola variabilis 225]TWH27383.1 peptide/nickel transport system substrate-binding protein [Isoptericola variabilis J7]